MTVTIVPTGTANMASVFAAFSRLGAKPRIANRPDEVAGAEGVVIPGVGSFGAAMSQIDRIGLREAIRDRLSAARPTLAICVGMQLLAGSSDESDDVVGFGHLEAEVRRFPDTVLVPQLGWNRVDAGEGCRHVRNGWAYFANSYRIVEAPAGWSVAMADHGGRFVAALERGPVLGCQFHPELSGAWGAAIISSWLDEVGEVG
jgi:imidazole glycerol-phosphate synthase subunit HisH